MSRLAVVVVACVGWLGSPDGADAAEKHSLPEFLLQSWNDDDGLPSSPVRAIAHTPDGYLWIGTDRGLARFDGVRYVTLTTNEIAALSDNRISALLVDAAGELWVGAQDGSLCRRSSGSFVAVPQPPLLRGASINAMAQDRNGALWLATTGAGVARWQEGNWEFFRRTNGLPLDGALTVAADRAGDVWAISAGRLFVFEQGRFVVPDGVADFGLPISLLHAARDGDLWLATSQRANAVGMGGRIFRVQNRRLTEELTPYPWPQDTFHTDIHSLCESRDGRVWVGMMGAGVYFRDPKTGWQSLGPKGDFSQVLVNCMMGDDLGNLWVGMDGAQLDHVRSRPVKTLHLPEAAGQHVIRMACARQDGSVWVGTDGEGVFRFVEGNVTQPTADRGLANRYIGAMLEDRNTNLWVGTWGGLFRLNGEHFAAAYGVPALRGTVRSLLEDRAGNLWVGTGAGVIRLRDDKATVFEGGAGYAGSQVLAIEEDAAGNIWAALSARGLYRLVGERFEHSDSDPWSGKAEICALHAGADGGLWCATLAHGLACVEKGSTARWTTRDGLPSDGIRTIMEDVEGNLWFGSDNGIFGSPPARLKAYERGVSPPLLLWQLSSAEGLETRRCSGTGQPVAARSKDGRLWIPNWRALAVFDPVQLPRSYFMRPVLLEEVLVDGAVHMVGEDRRLQVKSNVRSFEFHYTSPHLQTPERLRFRVRLHGADSEWVEAGSRRVAYYGHLDPGNYELKVMVGGPEGVWQESGPLLRVEVVPLFWERRSLQAAGALTLLGGVAATVWGIERGRSRRRLQRIEAQQAMERERRRIARDLHDDLGSDLTELMLLGERASQPEAPVEAIRSHAGAIAVRSRQASAAMDEIVWTVNPKNDSVTRLADRLAERVRRLFEPSPVQLQIEIMEDLPALPLPATARHNLFLTVKEAQNNVAKHSGATEVKMSVGFEGDRLMMTIEDNGRGFDPAAQSGSRNGLENMRQRMESIGGTFQIESQPGGGTKVRIEFPLKQSEAGG